MPSKARKAKLLPCPFCGQSVNLEAGEDPATCWFVACRGACGTEGPERDSKAEAIAAWNRRSK